jgi:hypothetical protein
MNPKPWTASHHWDCEVLSLWRVQVPKTSTKYQFIPWRKPYILEKRKLSLLAGASCKSALMYFSFVESDTLPSTLAIEQEPMYAAEPVFTFSPPFYTIPL